MYTLYVIPGSHACRTAMLALEHKRVPYRRVDFVPPTHPLMARLRGFDAGGQTRATGRHDTRSLRIGDRLATVPALDADGERVSTNHGIARFLDARHPEPPLFPADPGRRAAVEEAERWGNGELQMTARRVLFAAAVRDPAGFSRAAAGGRMGTLLYRRPRARRLMIPWMGRRLFEVGPAEDAELLAQVPPLLDRVDAWISEGVLDGPRPNAADLMIAPPLALMLYRRDVRPLFDGRPALALVDRLLPEPAGR